MDSPPGSWEKVDTRYPFQEDRWQNTESGEYLIIEGKAEPWHGDDPPELSLVLVSEDFEDNPEPIRTIVESTREYTDLVQAAFEWMLTHKSGVR